MADTLATTLIAKLGWSFQEALDLSTVFDSASLDYSVAMSDGTSDSAADKIWHDSRSLNTATNDDLDLTALTNSIFGSTVTISFAKVRAILIVNTATTTGHKLTIDTSVANGFNLITGAASGKIEIPANSVFFNSNVVTGWAVANGSTDVLRINNASGSTIAYKIAIVGTSA